MKKLFNPLFYVCMLSVIALFSSCEKEGVTSIKINKTTLSLNVGIEDTIQVTVGYTGDLPSGAIKWTIADPTVLESISEFDGAKVVANSESSVEKNIAVRAKKSGTTKVTLTAGDKTIDCVVTVVMRKLTFTQIIANNYGDSYDVNLNNFEVLLYESSIKLNSQGQFVGDGAIVVLDLNVPITQNTFASGNFTVSENFEENTFTPGFYYANNDGYYFSLFVSTLKNVRTFGLITGGSYSISSTAEGFAITGELVIDNKEVVQFEYNGSVNVADKRDDDEVKPALTHGLLHYYGDFYQTGVSNNFSVYLAEASLNFADTATNGDLLAMEVNVPKTVTDSLPNGTYNMITELKTSNLVEFTVIPGFYDEEYNEYGTWFYPEDENKNSKKLKTGSMTVLKKGAKTYEISYSFMDRFGAVVSGTFNGDLEYTDKTKSASGVKAAKVHVKTKAITAVKRNFKFIPKQNIRSFRF